VPASCTYTTTWPGLTVGWVGCQLLVPVATSQAAAVRYEEQEGYRAYRWLCSSARHTLYLPGSQTVLPVVWGR